MDAPMPDPTKREEKAADAMYAAEMAEGDASDAEQKAAAKEKIAKDAAKPQGQRDSADADAKALRKSAKEDREKADKKYKEAAEDYGTEAETRKATANIADDKINQFVKGELREELCEAAAHLHLLAAQDYQNRAICLRRSRQAGIDIAAATQSAQEQFGAAADEYADAAQVNVDDGEPKEAIEVFEAASRAYASAGKTKESKEMDDKSAVETKKLKKK
jgi:hypothetical protein